MGRSIAAGDAPPTTGGCSFEKQAPTVSYGAHADDLFTTLRRAPDAEPGDQVARAAPRASETELEPTGTWDTLGMRGTCSPGFVVRARFAPEQILPAPFATVMNESMVPLSHILWSHVLAGDRHRGVRARRARSSARRARAAPGRAAAGGACGSRA